MDIKKYRNLALKILVSSGLLYIIFSRADKEALISNFKLVSMIATCFLKKSKIKPTKKNHKNENI